MKRALQKVAKDRLVLWGHRALEHLAPAGKGLKPFEQLLRLRIPDDYEQRGGARDQSLAKALHESVVDPDITERPRGRSRCGARNNAKQWVEQEHAHQQSAKRAQ